MCLRFISYKGGFCLPFISNQLNKNNMKKSEPLTLSQMLLIGYLILLSAFIMVLGIISFLTLKLWLIALILGLPIAIYLCLKVKQYIYEGGLEEDFKSGKKL